MAKLSLSILLVASIVSQNGHYVPSRWNAGRITPQRNERWSDATKLIAAIDPKGELPLFIASGFIESRALKTDSSPLLREYCRLPVATLYRVPQAELLIEPISSIIPAEPPELWTERVLQNGGGVWLLRVRPNSAAKWASVLKRLGQSIELKSPPSVWTLEMHVVAGITIFELRRIVSPSP